MLRRLIVLVAFLIAAVPATGADRVGRASIIDGRVA
jgi:hypothetical protein